MSTAQKIKFYIKDLFSKCDQVCSFLRIWSHVLKKPVMQNFIFVSYGYFICLSYYCPHINHFWKFGFVFLNHFFNFDSFNRYHFSLPFNLHILFLYCSKSCSNRHKNFFLMAHMWIYTGEITS